MTILLSLAAVCIAQFLGRIRAEDNFRSSYFNLQPEHRLAGHVIATTTADSELSCAHKCLALDGCKSGNFRMSGEKHENCELSSRGPLSQTHDPTLVHDEEFVLISLENESPHTTESAVPGRPGSFQLFQNFPTSGGVAATTFVISGELFLAFANRRDRSLGQVGKAKLPIYQLQESTFTLNQTLDTLEATDIEHFTIQGKHFLVVANFYDGSSKAVDSIVYRWEVGQFKEFQRMPTNGAFEVHYFPINERKFLLIDNLVKNVISIYEWKGGKFSDKVQDIPISLPYRSGSFTIHNITYIASGRYAGPDATTVLKWSGSQFQTVQNLPSSIVYGRPHSFHANDTVYLSIGNFQPFDTDSYIYRWNDTKFIHHQSILTHGALNWASFKTPEGEVFLVVANKYSQSGAQYNVKSAVYKMVDNKFNLYQQLPTVGAIDLHAFIHKGKQYLAVVNGYDGKSHNINSAVYIWK